MNAFQQDWGPLRGFTNPPWCLIGRALSHARLQAKPVLVAPVWRGQAWFPTILEMLWDFPRLIAPALIQRPTVSLMEMVPQLALWPVSRKDTLVAASQRRLLNFCFSPGESNQIRCCEYYTLHNHYL